MNSSRAALTWSAWVQAMACGPPSITTSCAFLMKPGSRWAVFPNGRTRSSSPWMTSTGTSILGRSSRKSVSQVGMQATAAIGRRGHGEVPAGLERLVADQGAAELSKL